MENQRIALIEAEGMHAAARDHSALADCGFHRTEPRTDGKGARDGRRYSADGLYFDGGSGARHGPARQPARHSHAGAVIAARSIRHIAGDGQAIADAIPGPGSRS